MNAHNEYITKYGNYIHILNIDVNHELCETEKNTILNTIYDKIHDKRIVKDVHCMNIPIKWLRCNETDLFDYYTDGGYIFGNKVLREHTRLVFNDIQQIINKDNFNIILTRPVSKTI